MKRQEAGMGSTGGCSAGMSRVIGVSILYIDRKSVGSRHTGGNTILLATNNQRLMHRPKHCRGDLPEMAQQCSGVNFDVVARTTHKLWLS
eukprot:scaffold8149_cov130-Skeletonema_dohrnii-CCMP3373.AAC.2